MRVLRGTYLISSEGRDAGLDSAGTNGDQQETEQGKLSAQFDKILVFSL